MAKVKQAKFSDKNFIEAAAGDITTGVVNSVKNDLLENSISSAWKQLLLTNEKVGQKTAAMSGDLQEGEEINFSKTEKLVSVEAAIDYKSEVLHFEKKTTQIKEGQLNQRVEQIMLELKQLSKSMQQLETQVKDVDMGMLPQTVGKYHENFFEFILSSLRNARIKIEDSTNWLSAVGKKSSKKGFAANAKQHGTSYTLSADRAVSQQVG